MTSLDESARRARAASRDTVDGDIYPTIPAGEPVDLSQTPEIEPDQHNGSGATEYPSEDEQAVTLDPDCAKPDYDIPHFGVDDPGDDADETPDDPDPVSDEEYKRRGNRLSRKLTGAATVGDEATYCEGEFSRSWSLAHGTDKFLFVKGVGWLAFEAGIWRDGAGAARRSMAALIKDRVSHTKFAPRFDRAATVDGALKMSQVEPTEGRTVELGCFDADPMAIGLPGGRIFDIAKGAERPAEPNDRVRKELATAPDPELSRAKHGRTSFTRVLVTTPKAGAI